VKFARKACRNLQDEFIKHGESSAGVRAKEELLTGLMILADIHSRQVQQPCPEGHIRAQTTTRKTSTCA